MEGEAGPDRQGAFLGVAVDGGSEDAAVEGAASEWVAEWAGEHEFAVVCGEVHVEESGEEAGRVMVRADAGVLGGPSQSWWADSWRAPVSGSMVMVRRRTLMWWRWRPASSSARPADDQLGGGDCSKIMG